MRFQSYSGATEASAGTIKGNRGRIYNVLMFNSGNEVMTPDSWSCGSPPESLDPPKGPEINLSSQNDDNDGK